MKKKDIDLAGMNIYLDTCGNTVYYNIFDKNGYVISSKLEQKFRAFYYRYFIIVALLVLLGDYFKTFENTLLVGVVACVLSEIYFRSMFLKKLKCVKDFKREKKVSKVQNLINNSEKDKMIMKSCAYIVLSILLVINTIQQNYNVAFVILNMLIVMYSIYSVAINLIAFNKINNR